MKPYTIILKFNDEQLDALQGLIASELEGLHKEFSDEAEHSIDFYNELQDHITSQLTNNNDEYENNNIST